MTDEMNNLPECPECGYDMKQRDKLLECPECGYSYDNDRKGDLAVELEGYRVIVTDPNDYSIAELESMLKHARKISQKGLI